MHRPTKLFLALALVMSVSGLTAGIIDFDDATSGAAYPSASDSGVTVNFYTGSNATVCAGGCAPPAGSAFGAAAGGTETAFVPFDMRAGGNDSPFLTDEADGPLAALDYFMTFSIGIPNLSLDLLDYRDDGGPTVGGTAFLQVFSSADWDPANLIGFDSFVIPAVTLDGNVVTLATNPGIFGPILSARVTFSQPDIGTGIDNLEWTTTAIPEPGTVILFGTGLLALGAIVRKRRGPQA